MVTIGPSRWQGRGHCPTDNPITSLKAGKTTLQVEIAANNEARQCGLAFRDRLPPDAGMLFVHAEQQRLRFWMKDTRIPLALAFVDTDRRITEIHQLTPDMGQQDVRSSQPVRFALETNPYWFDTNQVSVGDRLIFSLPDDLVVE